MGKEEGRVVGLWPGSCLHAIRALEYQRWEDFKTEPLDSNKTQNRFFWLGDGSTRNEKDMTGNRKLVYHLRVSGRDKLLMKGGGGRGLLGAWYLDDDEVDIPLSACSTKIWI